MWRTSCMVLAVLLGFVSVAAAATPPQTKEGPTVPVLKDVKPEILQLVIDDQWDRGNDMFGGRQVKAPTELDWEAISHRDQQRQARARELLREGQVQTGRGFHYVALLFQHSATVDDLALAHILAVTALIQGDGGAKWLAAATFDRYRQNEKEGQVFGTQFMSATGESKYTMEPYDKAAIPDSVRSLWCVVSISDQKQALANLQSGRGSANTSIQDCR